MKLLADQSEPPGFASICRAFHMAKHVPSRNLLHLRIGIVDADGLLVAEDMLEGHRQAAFLADHMHSLGYVERLRGGTQEMYGCDVVFVAPEPGEDARAQRSGPWPAHEGKLLSLLGARVRALLGSGAVAMH